MAYYNGNMAYGTTGRNCSDMQALVTDFGEQLENIKSMLTGSKYNELVEAANRNWEGASKTAFMTDLEDKISKAKTAIDHIKDNIATIVEADWNAYRYDDQNMYDKLG